MAVIKRSSADDLTRDAIVLDLGDLQRQAAAMLASARAEAERIANDARDERRRIMEGAAEAGREQGYQAGLEAGTRAGIDQGRQAALVEHAAKLAAIEHAWEESLSTFESQRRDLLLSAQTDLLRLAVAIAERVTHTVVRADPGVAAAQVEAVLRTVVLPTRLRLRIHPEDRATVESALPRLIARLASSPDVELIDDASVGRGSCIACSGGDPAGASDAALAVGGRIDASIQTQLDRIVAALLPEGRAAQPSADGPVGAATARKDES